jgi:hypothetical protein
MTSFPKAWRIPSLLCETDQLGKPGERYLLGKVLIDIGGDDALLPSRETPSHRSFPAPNPGIEPRQLVRQDDAESLKIGSAGRGRTLDQPRQLERRLPQRVVLEEQPRGQDRACGAHLTRRPHLSGIEIEEYHARGNE